MGEGRGTGRRATGALVGVELLLGAVFALAGNVFTGALPGWWGWVKDWQLLGGIVAGLVLVTIAVGWWRARREQEGAPADPSPVLHVDRSPGTAAATGTRPTVVGSMSGGILARDHARVDARVDARHMTVTPPVPRAAEVRAGGRVVRLPRPPSAAFVGRGAVLAGLDDAMRAGRGGVLGQAVAGLGGVGKTEVALQYVAASHERYELVWWVTADSAEAVELGLAGLAREMHPQPVTGWEIPEAAGWGRSWLASRGGWLLVLDNVTDPGHVAEVLGCTAEGGRVLVTSRRSLSWRRWGLETLPLGMLDRADSVALLRRLLGSGIDEEQAAGLAADLGDLPLAVEQAGAYLAQRPQVGIGEYRRRLTETPARTLTAVARGGPADRAVAATWQVTMDTILAEDPLAGQVLAVAAYLASQQIPASVFTGLAEESGAVEDAITLLGSYSMLTVDTDGTLAVHRLVQAVTRSVQTDDEAYRQTLGLLRSVLPDEPVTNVAGWPVWNRLLPQVDAAVTSPPDTTTEATLTQLSTLLDLTARYQHGQGQISEAIRRFERARELDERVLGADHPDTLASRNNLAGAYRSAGRLTEAIPLYEQTLTDRQRVLGADHPSTLISRNNLAYAYESAGRLTDAIPLYEQTLTDRQRVLGADHPSTLTSRGNLAYAYQSAGRLTDAIPFYEEALAGSERALSEGHPLTATIRGNLESARAASRK